VSHDKLWLSMLEVVDIVTCNKFFGGWLRGSNLWGIEISCFHRQNLLLLILCCRCHTASY